MNAMQLIEILKNIDPLTPIVFETSDIETGYHFKEVKGFKEDVVRMTSVVCVDAFDGTCFTIRQLMSCAVEKPNAFNVLVIK